VATVACNTTCNLNANVVHNGVTDLHYLKSTIFNTFVSVCFRQIAAAKQFSW